MIAHSVGHIVQGKGQGHDPSGQGHGLNPGGQGQGLDLQGQSQNHSYDAKSNARRKWYLGYIASNQYKVAEPVFVTYVLIALDIENIFCLRHAQVGAVSFPRNSKCARRLLMKSRYFISATLIDRLVADDVAALVWRRRLDKKRDVFTTLLG